jgi:RHS repeat-associated protein
VIVSAAWAALCVTGGIMGTWNRRSRPAARRWKDRAAKALAVTGLMGLVLMFLPAVAFAAAYAPGQVWTPPQTKLASTTPVPGSFASTTPNSAARKAAESPAYRAPRVDLPTPGTTTTALTGAARSTASATSRNPSAATAASTRVGTSPLWVAPATSGAAAPAKVQVRFAATAAVRKAGFSSGLVFGVARSDASTSAGKVTVQLDPSLLAGESGGDLGQRLRLVELPACALTTPNLTACQQQTPVKTTTDARTGRLDVTVPLGAGVSVTATQAPRSSALVAVSPPASGGAARDVASPMTVLAATSAPAGSAGTFAATSIKPSDQWSAGGSTGDFTYSYPITVPGTLGGAAPSVALSYASSSVDGETVDTNSQVSGVGDGWSDASSFIERSYQPCSQDGIAGSSDACWADGGHEVNLSGGNMGGQMVWDDATGTWHLSGSDATINLVTGGANGAYDGEYWEITTEDGSRMYYGAGKLPTAEGGTGSDVATNSVSTEPVYCPTKGDCDGATSGAAGDYTTNMPYRWYLDFVIDPHGNTTEYSYTQETNYYARSSAHTDTLYDRDAYLDAISYGWRASDIAAEGAKPAPAAKVVFAEAERCIVTPGDPTANPPIPAVTSADCGTSLTTATAPYWYDVPFDQVCASIGTCANHSSSYFSEMRLTGIATYVNTGSTTVSSYKEVDSYALDQSFPATGDGTSPELRLESITRTGWDGGTSLAMQPVTFGYTQMANRVAGAAGWPAMMHYRINEVSDETGGVTDVFYSAPDCNQSASAPDLPSPSDDTRQCYQEYWTPPDSSMISDWFEKYVVTEVEQLDAVGGSPEQVTHYSYPLGAAAWHRNDSPLTPNAQRTWDQWRGYASVITETGTAPDPVTETQTTYLRGMDGDSTSATADTPGPSVTATTTDGQTVTDANQYAGYVLETQTYHQAGGSVVSDDISLPWSVSTATHAETATGIPAGVPAEQTWYVDPQTTIDRGALSTGGWRTTKTVDTYNSTTGMLAQTDSQGDTSLLGTPSSTETCSTVSYATPPATGLNTGMTGLPGETSTVSVTSGSGVGTSACPAKTAANAVSDTLTYYDGDTTPGVIPSGGVGNVTEAKTMGTWSGSTEGWTVTATSPSGSTGFDAYGRQLSTTNTRGDTETYAYTPATGTLPDSTAVTNVTAGNWTTATSVDQLRQLPTKLVDANGNTTTETYDPLGRLTGVWLPGNTSTNASKKFTYSLGGQSARTWTETQTLRDDSTYDTEYEIYNGFMQPLQEQSLSLDSADSNGSNVTDFAYDSHGWQVKTTSTPYYISAAPSSNLYLASDVNVPGQTVTTYDGLGRGIGSAFYSYGHPQWSSSTAYPGVDRTDTTAPPGGAATATVVDAQGRTTASLEYHSNTPTGTATETDYAYTVGTVGTASTGGLNTVTTITDASQHKWTQTADAQGNRVAATDPDAGASSATYDAEGDELTSTDGNGTVLSYTYDALGRKTAEYDGTTQDQATEIASWSYDTATDGKGLPASQSSYYTVNRTTAAYTESTAGYTDLGSPTQTTVTIPSTEGNLAGSYSVSDYYTTYTGTLDEQDYGADGGLPAEDVGLSYTEGGTLDGVAGNTDYLTQVISNPLGQVTRATVGTMPDQLVQTNDYDTATDRVTETILDQENDSTGHLDDTSTYWDAAGQITAQNDVEDNGANTDLQCYTYDGQGRLTTAWTDTAGVSSAASPSVPDIGGCNSTVPSAATNGGPAPYWEAYGYDPNGQSSGNRSTVTDYNTSGAVTSNQSYGYNTATGTTGQPDALQNLTTTNASGGTLSTASYDYYPDGSAKARTVTSGTGTITGDQSYAYDPTGLTHSITDTVTGNSTDYEYDASGTLLLQKDTIAGDTTTTLYLPGEELFMNSSGGITAQRYYGTGTGITVIRDNTGNLTYETGTSQGTGTLTISSTLTGESRRYYTPYGATRGTTPSSWINGLGYLNQPADPATNLDLLGAREYDPATGRFLQRDPVVEATDPNQLGGYTYSGDDPVNGADPTGLTPWVPGTGQQYRATQPATGDGGGGGGGGGDGGGNDGGGNDGSGSGDGGNRPGTSGNSGGGTPTPAAVKRALQLLISIFRGHGLDSYFTPPSITLVPGVSSSALILAAALYNGMIHAAETPIPAKPKPVAPTQDNFVPFDCGHLGWECQGKPQVFRGSGGGIPKGLKEAALSVSGVLLTAADVVQFGADPITDSATAADGELLYEELTTDESTADDGSASCSTGNSFAPATPVLMAGGTTEPISEVKPGEKVEAANPATGKLEGPRTVVATMVHDDSNLIDINIRDTHGHTSTLHTTTEHMFWDGTLETWVAADQLTPGQALETPSGGHAYIVSLRATPGSAYRYNLTIQQLHTYYVLAGTTPVLVHNSGSDPAVNDIPSLNEMQFDNAFDFLEENGFAAASWSGGLGGNGGYVTFKGPDGSKITIRDTDGRVTRTSSIDRGPNTKNGVQRWDDNGEPTDSHDHGENVNCE